MFTSDVSSSRAVAVSFAASFYLGSRSFPSPSRYNSAFDTICYRNMDLCCVLRSKKKNIGKTYAWLGAASSIAFLFFSNWKLEKSVTKSI